MAVKDQKITSEYAIYNADANEVMEKIPDDKIGLSVYSPPFTGMYQYSSDERDLSNCDNYEDFFKHYEFIVKALHRITMPGRLSVVHCMDVPNSNSGKGDSYIDFPGDIIRLHEKLGFEFRGRRSIWKEPLRVRLRTMQKNLAHQTVVEDSVASGVAAADYILVFAKKGENKVPVTYPNGLQFYAGDREIPEKLLMYKNWTGKQTGNKFSHWIWRQYASSQWDDIRIDNVLKFKQSRDQEDEKHVHPLQLDVIERLIILYSNPREVVFTPFMGVGSEVYGAVINDRKGVGVELKPSYFRQAVMNLKDIKRDTEQPSLYEPEDFNILSMD